MKKGILPTMACCFLILTACTSPNYGNEAPAAPIVEKKSTEVFSIYGVVMGITDDNQLQIKVSNPEEITSQGLNVNTEGIIEVGLAAVELSSLDAPGVQKLTQLLRSKLLNEDVLVDLPVDKKPMTNELLGFISFESENESITLLQDLLASEFTTNLIDASKLEQAKPILENIKQRSKGEITKILQEFNLLGK